MHPFYVRQHFNSIKVRLEHRGHHTTIGEKTFQFHKGTIRTKEAVAVAAALGDFNSIKVRLELVADELPAGALEFQFHKGTIRTFRPSTSRLSQ